MSSKKKLNNSSSIKSSRNWKDSSKTLLTIFKIIKLLNKLINNKINRILDPTTLTISKKQTKASSEYTNY